QSETTCAWVVVAQRPIARPYQAQQKYRQRHGADGSLGRQNLKEFIVNARGDGIPFLIPEGRRPQRGKHKLKCVRTCAEDRMRAKNVEARLAYLQARPAAAQAGQANMDAG